MNAMAHFPLLLPTRGPLSRRLTISFRTIMIMMLVPALLSIAMLTSFSQLYYSFLTRAEKINSLSVLVVDTLPAEMFSIAAGRKRFPEGRQDALMAEIQQTLDSLISERPASELELTVALRTSETMGKYIQQMGQQMQSGSAVDEDMLVLEEIRNVSSLLGDMFTDAVSAEIRAANATSQQLRAALFITVALETALVAFALAFIRAAGGALSRAVANPLADLQAFAGKIADGQLDERTPEPDVDELRDLSASLNVMAGKLDGLIKENKREQENLKKSELRVLQAQVTPHFLYNTLDDWITVAQEEEHLRGYLTIQKIRYRDILDYDIRIDPTLKNEMILKLSIQPLVENALYHGIKNRRGGGSITIDVRRQEGSLYVHVSDNGIGMAPERLRNLRDMRSGKEPSADSGVGLYSVDQRIKLYYDQPQGLKVDSALGQGTAISFSVPLNHQAR